MNVRTLKATGPVTDLRVRTAADRLDGAIRSRTPCEPVRDLLGTTDIQAAYEVQRILSQRRLRAGARVVGRKIGLTSHAVQQQLGVDRPDFGVLFDDMWCSEDLPVPMSRLLQPKAEAEVAFLLGKDLEHGDLGVAQVREAVSWAAAALEIVDSRVLDWDITITDTVADNASSGLFVIGAETVPLSKFEPAEVRMTLSKNGVEASAGDGRACLGDPLIALSWLARTAREFGDPLRAGEIVLSGALGPMVAVTGGDQVVAEISTLGPISATFAEDDE